jgi:flagellar hook-associated protein 1 FlgK
MAIANLSTALTSATSGLRASQATIDTISRNIANAQTDGYTRKIIELRNIVSDRAGGGVDLVEPIRKVDGFLQKDGLAETARTAALSVKDTYLNQLQEVFGRPNDNTTIAAQLNELQQAFDSLVVNPTDPTQQRLVLAEADRVCQMFRQLTTSIQAMRTQADMEIGNAITLVNTNLTKIAELNGAIGLQKQSGHSSADLEDLRDQLIKDVNEQLGVRYFERDPQTGQYGTMTEGSRFIVDVAPISLNFFTPVNAAPVTLPIVAPGTSNPIVSGTPIVSAVHQYLPPDGVTTFSSGKLVNLGSVYALVGGQYVDIKSEIASGKIAGLFELRDTILPEAQAQLDQIAAAIAIGFQNTDIFNATGTNVTANTEIEVFQDSGGPPSYLPTATFAATAAAEVGFAGRIAVNSVFTADPWRIVHGTNTATTPTQPTLNGDITRLQRVQQLFENPNPPGAYPSVPPYVPTYQNKMFPNFTVNGLPAQNTLEGAAASFVGYQANSKADIEDKLDAQQALSDALTTRLKSDSGVNTDEELALMIQMQNSYGASARVVTTVNRLFDELLAIAGR